VEAESLPIRAQCGDVATTSIPGDSVDVVFCNEAISHFHDWRAFLVEVARVLRPGGRLVIADWNNGANAWVRRSIRREWRESEVGPFLADRFSPGQRSAPYLFRRWMILRREFPELGDESVFQLGLRTSGSGGEELRGAAREYLRTGKLPDRIYRNGTSPRRPEDGQRHEEPVDPREIVRILRGVGVESFARPHFGFSRSALLPLVNRVAAGFGNLPLLFAPKYRVYGRKSQ
jgi:SAM-dependent methyltransferase